MASKCKSVQDFGVASVMGKSNLQMLHDLRFEYPKNLFCGYLNSPRNKIHALKKVIYGILLDYFVISETKLDDSFPSAQLTMNNYE